MWLRNGNLAGKGMKWADAMEWVKKLNCGDFRDWRLPTREEFELFVKRGGGYSSKWFFNDVQADGYWSSSTYANNTGSAWVVNMSDGYVDCGSKYSSYYVWPVRS